jgi:hypothetical protein
VEKSDQLSSISYKSEITMFKLLKSPVFPMVFQWNSYGKTEEVCWTTMVGRFIGSEWKTNRSGRHGVELNRGMCCLKPSSHKKGRISWDFMGFL